jgi:glycerol-3-phosphate dehydrogenase
MARTVEDFLARRRRILFLDARASLETAPAVAKLMATELKKGTKWQKSQIESFQKTANNYLIH